MNKKTIIIDNEREKTTFSKSFTNILIAGLIVLAGIVTTYLIFKTAPKASPDQKLNTTIHVETIALQPQQVEIPINLSGITEAVDLRQISSNINGSIVAINSAFEHKQLLKKGEWLIKTKDERLKPQLEQAQAQLKTAEAAYKTAVLTTKHNNAALAELGIKATANPPQLIEARGRLSAAQSHANNLKQQLEQSILRLPYDARIIKRLVNVGDIVSIGFPIAQTLASDKILARFAINDAELKLLEKQNFTRGQQLPIEVRNNNDDVWRASIIDLELGSTLNNQINYLIAEIYQPFINQNTQSSTAEALSIGDNVKTTIHSKTLQSIYKIPLEYVHNGNQIWIYNNKKLQISNIDIVYRGEDDIYTNSTITNNGELITSNINLPIDGMQLRTVKNK